MHSLYRCTDSISLFACELLGDAQLLVTKNSGEELSALCRRHRRHHAELLLSSEVGVEEFRQRHPKAVLEKLGHTGNGIGDRGLGAIQVELGAGQPADDAISVRSELEVQLHLDGRACAGAHEPNRIAIAANRLIPVERPGDRFENRRLASAVRADDARETSIEADLRPDVLPKVGEAETIESHAIASSSPVGPASASASRR